MHGNGQCCLCPLCPFPYIAGLIANWYAEESLV